jgi:hypothetical protein
MKILRIAVIVALITALVGVTAWADGVVYRGNGSHITFKKTYYPKKSYYPHTFRPVSEYIEDGVALVFDLPLALMSPILCPIVGPIMDAVDPVENRSFHHKRRR